MASSAGPRLPRVAGVYLITGPNGRVYVGSTHNMGKRCRDHWRDLSDGSHHNILLQRAWNKHGGAAFVFSVLEVCDIDHMIVREQFHIDSLHAADPLFGYNLAPRADSILGLKRRPESNAATARGLRGRKLTAERKAKNKEWWESLSDDERAEINRKRTNSHKARYAAMSPERKLEIGRAISMARTGYVMPVEVRNKIASTLSGRTLSPEHRAKSVAVLHKFRWRGKLADHIDRIKELRSAGRSYCSIAKEYGVTRESVRKHFLERT